MSVCIEEGIIPPRIKEDVMKTINSVKRVLDKKGVSGYISAMKLGLDKQGELVLLVKIASVAMDHDQRRKVTNAVNVAAGRDCKCLFI